MSLREPDIHVTSPCPIDLDETGMRGTGAAWHCGHCSKTVHVLSSMTETQARTFLTAHAGQDICVSYSMSREGEIRFRPAPVVPLSALSRRPRIAAAAAIGLSVAMAACAPHENPRIEPAPVADVATPGNPTLPMIPVQRYQPPQPIEPEVIAVAGGLMAEPPPPEIEPDLQIEGGMRVPERQPTVQRDAPCDPPSKTVNVRGGRRAPARGR
ncbi:MAG: hypothetical protein IAG13_10415 [Deltaproteobacteria bacterium]|nr:hypothetical protein [Nannocystaceae bacterium]